MVWFNQSRRQLKKVAIRAICLLMVTAAVWSGGWVQSANAVGSEKAAEIMQDRAAAEVDRMAGKGTVDEYTGAAKATAGKAQRGLGNATDDMGIQLDGAGKELKGKVQRDLGRAKGKAADLGEDIEDSADSVVDSIKDFFD